MSGIRSIGKMMYMAEAMTTKILTAIHPRSQTKRPKTPITFIEKIKGFFL